MSLDQDKVTRFMESFLVWGKRNSVVPIGHQEVMVGSEKLTKAELVERIAESSGLTKKQIHGVIDTFLLELKSALIEDKVIEFRGFGTFEVRTRKGREKARNPKTGQLVSVDNHGVVNFRPGKELKERIWSIRT